MLRKPTDRGLFIGISAPGIKPDVVGYTYENPTSYGMWGSGAVAAAGIEIIDWQQALPASAILDAQEFAKRDQWDRAFTTGDEVLVTLDFTAHTLTLQSPTIRYTLKLEQKHQDGKWVLNVNLSGGDYDIKLLA